MNVIDEVRVGTGESSVVLDWGGRLGECWECVYKDEKVSTYCDGCC